MHNNILKYFGITAILLLLQFLVLNNINFLGYVNPYIYVLVILLLPYRISRWMLLVVGFALGFTVDYFSNTLGLHTTATLVLAYSRPVILSRWSFRSIQDIHGVPDISNTSIEWFIVYTILAVLVHHFVLFFLEVFSFKHLWLTMVRIILSTAVSTFFIVIIELMRIRNKMVR
ncbi:MAG TPA: rod shape-determining protein MreD [Bacteroidales bacterium]|nr:rod shape-determining protein MreD [Bacteroidales bacterium]